MSITCPHCGHEVRLAAIAPERRGPVRDNWDPIDLFVEERCILGATGRVESAALLAAFRAWGEGLPRGRREAVAQVTSKALVAGLIERFGVARQRSSGVRYLAGLHLRA